MINITADRNLEETALKAIIEHPSAIVLFGEEMFASPHTSIIFTVIQETFSADEQIDKSLLISRLLQRDSLKLIGGEGVIDSLFGRDYSPTAIENYAQRLRELSLKRYAQIALYSIVESAPHKDLAELFVSIADVQDTILNHSGITTKQQTFAQLIQQEVESIITAEDTGRFIPTGMPDYDLLLGGVEKSNLEIIAGRPSMGKSSLMLRWMLNFASRGIKTEIISFEMSNQQLSKRIISMETGIPGQRIDRRILTEEEKNTIRTKGRELQQLPLHVSYKSVSNITDIINHIRLSHRDKEIEIFAIDYINLMQVPAGNETTGYAAIAKSLKSLAVELDIVIILLSQLNRGLEHRKNKRPILSDLRQSGGLEESADKVIFVYREHMYYPNEQNRGYAEIILGKNRNGPTATFNIMFNKDTTNFYTLGHKHGH